MENETINNPLSSPGLIRESSGKNPFNKVAIALIIGSKITKLNPALGVKNLSLVTGYVCFVDFLVKFF